MWCEVGGLVMFFSKVTTWHEVHENCKVWCTQVGWRGEICSRLLKHGCNEKCRKWEFFFIWQISKMWSPTPVKWLGGKWLERFPWAQVPCMVEVRMLPGFICFFFQMFCWVSLLSTGNEVFECFHCYTSHVWTDLVVNRHWIKLSFDHIWDWRIRMSGRHIPVWLHSMLQALGTVWPIYALCRRLLRKLQQLLREHALFIYSGPTPPPLTP